MGGCATKPKVLKEAPAPEPAKDDKPSAAPEPPVVVETPVVVVVGVTEGDEKIDAKEKEVEGDKVKEIVDDDKVDDQDSKRRSLSILFKENAEGKDSTGDGNPAVETLKEEPPVNVKPTYESETTVLEVEKTVIPVEQTPVPEVVDAQKPETPVQQSTPVSEVVDAQKSETPVQLSEVVYAPEKAEPEKTTESTAAAEKKTQVPDVVADDHTKTERHKAVEAVETTSEEKKTEALDVGSGKEEAKAHKAIEAEVDTTETHNYGTSEEKKTEAKGRAEEKANV